MKRLQDEGGPLASLLRAAARDADDDRAARARVRRRLFAPGARRSWALAAVAVGAIAIGLSVSVEAERPVALVLPVDEGGVALRPSPTATASRSGRDVHLDRGTLDVAATSAVTVKSRGATVEATAASFRVSVAADSIVSVVVHEGEVAVTWASATRRVRGGEQWVSSEVSADERLHHEALELEREGQRARAIAVLDRLHTRSGTWGELATYDEARLLLAERDAARARALCDEYARRFPAGVLAREMAELSASSSRGAGRQ